MNYSSFLKFSLIYLLSFVFNYSSSAQTSQDSVQYGISVSFQSHQSDILLPIWLNNMNMLAPSIGIISIQDAGTQIELALVARFYLSKRIVASFLGGRVGTIIYSPTTGSSIKDFIVGICGGGEYYFSPNFSIGIEGQVTLGINDKNSVRFGSPGGKLIATGTSLFATIYF